MARRKLGIVLFSLPAIALVSIFVYVFVGQSINLSFTDWRFARPIHWIGFDNYIRLFTLDRGFQTSLINTVKLTVFFIGLTIPLGLGLAILLDLGVKGRGFFRTIYLIPLSFSFVVSSVMWMWSFLPESGTINTILRTIGLSCLAQPWITSTSQSLWSVGIVYIWQFSGFATLVYYTGIASVNPELSEAAVIDGATTWQKYRHVIIPQQKPATVTILILTLMYSLKCFDLVWLMTGGGPGYSSEVLATYMYKVTFNQNKFGYGASIGIVLVVLSMGVVGLFLHYMRRGEHG